MFLLNVLVIMAAVGDYRFGILDVEYCIIILLTIRYDKIIYYMFITRRGHAMGNINSVIYKNKEWQ